MKRSLQSLVAVALMLAALSVPAMAAEPSTVVKVALLDMSSVVPAGFGMTGPGMMGPGMTGQGSQWTPRSPMGYGMMGPGMMGGMMTIRVDAQTVKAGAVAFDVTNWSRSVLHEMLIVAVDGPSAPLPYDYERAVVPEDQVKVIDEAADLEPNATKRLEVTLAAGSYLLICNLPGHYAAGMSVPLTVTP